MERIPVLGPEDYEEDSELVSVKETMVSNEENRIGYSFSDPNRLLNALDPECDDFGRLAEIGSGLMTATAASAYGDCTKCDDAFLRRIDRRFLLDGRDSESEHPFISAVAGAVFTDGGYMAYAEWFDDVLSHWMDSVESIPDDFWDMAVAVSMPEEEEEEPFVENCFSRLKSEMDRIINPVCEFVKKQAFIAAHTLFKSGSQISPDHIRIISNVFPKKYAKFVAAGLVIVPLIVHYAVAGREMRE